MEIRTLYGDSQFDEILRYARVTVLLAIGRAQLQETPGGWVCNPFSLPFFSPLCTLKGIYELSASCPSFIGILRKASNKPNCILTLTVEARDMSTNRAEGRYGTRTNSIFKLHFAASASPVHNHLLVQKRSTSSTVIRGIYASQHSAPLFECCSSRIAYSYA